MTGVRFAGYDTTPTGKKDYVIITDSLDVIACVHNKLLAMGDTESAKVVYSNIFDRLDLSESDKAKIDLPF